jgi:hypothetical protein
MPCITDRKALKDTQIDTKIDTHNIISTMNDRTQRARERGSDNPTHPRVRRTNPQIRAQTEARQREDAKLGGLLSRFLGRQENPAAVPRDPETRR